MRLLVYLIVIICIPFSVLAQQDIAPADSVPETSFIRPIDRIQEDDRWNVVSPDLYTYWIDNGLYGMYGPQPEIFIDGMPVDANFFGWQNLNMLPITSPKTSVTGLSPGVYNNTLAPAGYINFTSSLPDSGFSATASVYVGNESGDPGPYAYDSLKTTPNVDRWGPDAEVVLSYRNRGWYSTGKFVFRNHFPTDLISKGRLQYTASLLGTNTQYVNHLTYITSASGLLETGYKGDEWSVRGRAIYSSNYDYIFLQPFGREVPAKTNFKQIGLEADYTLGDWLFTGRYLSHQKTINKRIDLHTYIFDWDQREHQIALSGKYEHEDFQLNPGVTYEYLETLAPGINQMQNNLITLSLDTRFPLDKNNSLQAAFSADINGNDVAKTLKTDLYSSPSQNWEVSPGVLFTSVLPIRQHSFAYWVNRGYTFAQELDIPFGEVSVEKNRLTEFKIENKFSFSESISLVLQPKLINHHTINVPFQQVEPYEFVTDTRPGIFTVTQEEGTRLGLYGELNHSYNRLFHQSLSINYQQTVDGTDRYESYFEQVPATKLQYQLDIQPVQSLIISLNGLYRTATAWNEFEAIDGNEYRLLNGIPIRDVSGTFRTETPAYFDVSLSVQKWFWDRKLSTQFGLKNLFNDDLRMHTLGAELSTKFDVEVKLNL